MLVNNTDKFANCKSAGEDFTIKIQDCITSIDGANAMRSSHRKFNNCHVYHSDDNLLMNRKSRNLANRRVWDESTILDRSTWKIDLPEYVTGLINRLELSSRFIMEFWVIAYL